MASPTGIKFVNITTNQYTAIEDAMTAALTPTVDASLLAALQALLASIGQFGNIGGRLNLVSGQSNPYLWGANPSITSGTMYWTPFNGQSLPIWNGNNFQMTNMGGELSQDATDTTKSPAAVVANTLYDIFGWIDTDGTPRATRGPAWTNSGAGTSSRSLSLSRVQGNLINSADITNGPKAGYGTYLGTILSDASATYTWSFGSTANGGGAAVLSLYNQYNRLQITTTVKDSGPSYTYTSNTIRNANNSANNRVSFVCGGNESMLMVQYATLGACVAINSTLTTFIGTNSSSPDTNFLAGFETNNVAATKYVRTICSGTKTPLNGFNYFQALEQGDNVNANIFEAFPATSPSGLTVTVTM